MVQQLEDLQGVFLKALERLAKQVPEETDATELNVRVREEVIDSHVVDSGDRQHFCLKVSALDRLRVYSKRLKNSLADKVHEVLVLVGERLQHQQHERLQSSDV